MPMFPASNVSFMAPNAFPLIEQVRIRSVRPSMLLQSLWRDAGIRLCISTKLHC